MEWLLISHEVGVFVLVGTGGTQWDLDHILLSIALEGCAFNP